MTRTISHRLSLTILAALAALALSAGSSLAIDQSLSGEPDDGDRVMAIMPESLPPHVLIAGRIVAVDRAAGRVEVEFRPTGASAEVSVTRFFRVSDTNLLLGHTPGDKIRFALKRGGRGRTIEWIENSN